MQGRIEIKKEDIDIFLNSYNHFHNSQVISIKCNILKNTTILKLLFLNNDLKKSIITFEFEKIDGINFTTIKNNKYINKVQLLLRNRWMNSNDHEPMWDILFTIDDEFDCNEGYFTNGDPTLLNEITAEKVYYSIEQGEV